MPQRFFLQPDSSMPTALPPRTRERTSSIQFDPIEYRKVLAESADLRQRLHEEGRYGSHGAAQQKEVKSRPKFDLLATYYDAHGLSEPPTVFGEESSVSHSTSASSPLHRYQVDEKHLHDSPGQIMSHLPLERSPLTPSGRSSNPNPDQSETWCHQRSQTAGGPSDFQRHQSYEVLDESTGQLLHVSQADFDNLWKRCSILEK